ncbi:MAG: SpoIIE family protein phosphatase [Pseudohongiella sp.]|nr:SpoIIE family protein phosphatase [Pseudohongiella sp.]
MLAGQSAEYRFCARQSQGARDYQEDDYGFLDARQDASGPEHTLLTVADGMGGHANGARASAIAAEAFIDAYQHSEQSTEQRLAQALHHANQCLTDAIDKEPALAGMGTTLVGVVIQQERMNWVSVGDSPLWLFRNGRLAQLNADHSMAPLLQQMVDTGRISAEEAATDPKRNSLLSALMGNEIELIDLPAEPMACLPGDLLVLGSDGLQTLTDAEIQAIVARHCHESATQISDSLMQAVEAKQKPGQDNVTVMVYRPAVSNFRPSDSALQSDIKAPTTATERPQLPVVKSSPGFGLKHLGAIALVLSAIAALVYLLSLS